MEEEGTPRDSNLNSSVHRDEASDKGGNVDKASDGGGRRCETTMDGWRCFTRV
ncbi:hypothetical protein Csa_004197 [Cucumis sativus]|uniref:Uncharacterized protein n=1 Tax=Cucumis sativus TaxID=3659 RepID=A0A0A0KGX8_CUCSA|nr:hypothetical protein Csa_004197 [Cucumis sativus]